MRCCGGLPSHHLPRTGERAATPRSRRGSLLDAHRGMRGAAREQDRRHGVLTVRLTRCAPVAPGVAPAMGNLRGAEPGWDSAGPGSILGAGTPESKLKTQESVRRSSTEPPEHGASSQEVLKPGRRYEVPGRHRGPRCLPCAPNTAPCLPSTSAPVCAPRAPPSCVDAR